jgi:superoxide dismutase, Fe-Mn family
MEKGKLFELPELNFSMADLAPFLSEEQLTIHYEKHHRAYVSGANAILEKIAKARSENLELDIRAISKELSFQISGHVLHSLFWRNLAPAGQGGGGEPNGILGEIILKQYGSFERFKKEFTQGAVSVEGSGWMAVIYCGQTGRILPMQIEKHNINVIPGHKFIIVLDVFEHAYYIDYKNDRAKYVAAFWNNINWAEAEKRLNKLIIS